MVRTGDERGNADDRHHREHAAGARDHCSASDLADSTAAVTGEELTTLIRPLRRVEGQVGGLVRMLVSGRDCAEVVTQLAAASRALDRVGFLLVAPPLRECVQRPASGDSGAEDKAAALEKLFLTLA